LEVADRHERTAISHERSADFWAARGDDERAALQRELAEHDRRGAQLVRRWAALVDGQAGTSD
jgi:hypothetical protein